MTPDDTKEEGDSSAIAAIDELSRLVRSGEVIAFAIATYHRNGGVGTQVTGARGADRWSLLGAVARLQHRMLTDDK